MPTLKHSGARIALAGTAAAALALAAGSPAFAQVTGVSGDVALVPVDGYDYGDLNPAETIVQEFQGAEIDVYITDEQLQQAETLEVFFTPEDELITAYPKVNSGSFCQAGEDYLVCTIQVTEDTTVADELPFEFGIQLNDTEAYGVAAGYELEIRVDGETVESYPGELEVMAGTPDGGEPEPTDPIEDPNETGGFEYEFAFLNHILSGANPGETLTGAPHIRVNSDSSLGEDRAATVVYFGDSIDTDLWIDEGEVEFTEAVEVVADYDNCLRIDYEIYCVLTDFDPQVGSTYTTSEDTPVLFEVLKTVTDADGAYYGAYDINQAGLDEAIADGIDPDGENTLTLVETGSEISDEYFSDRYGFVFFEGDDRGWGDVPPAGGDELPETGSSMTLVLTSALGAIAVGAVVFFVLRRRKTAENWG